MRLPFLGGLTARQFLSEYWQKKPLLVRNAFPGFTGLLTPDELAGLACLEEAEARLVQNKGDKWLLRRGPFSEEDFQRLPQTRWTLLVQGVNLFLREGTELMDRFNFIPRARLDDLMVSYAPKGGSVGPHFDPYDVFLIQGMGHRRWQISTQSDQTLLPGAPLRILQDFKPEQEWITAPGDLLYLPPQCAHYGLAQDHCMTYSVGFKAPYTQEIATQFLIYLQDEIKLEGIYQDPDLKPGRHPAEISPAMVRQVSAMLRRIRWDPATVGRFLGTYLSEPKASVYFDPPARPLAAARFRQRLSSHGIRLDLKSLMLFHGNTLFLNGEALVADINDLPLLMELADQRELPAGKAVSEALASKLYQWYCSGYLELE
jgi:50S ribosomal protein L16 3-hydroxylase